MTDMHCHILPGVDDGAESLDDALVMAELAAESGVDTIIATPHCNLPGAARSNCKSDELRDRFIELAAALRDARIPVKLLPGAEVLCTPSVPELLKKGRLLTLAGSDYLLVEFFFREAPDTMDELLARVAAEGVTPVIAHPERYAAVHRDPGVIAAWHGKGYVIQLNKDSLLGRLGRRAAASADWILAHGLAHIVASDAHSPLYRTPYMGEVRRHLEERYSPKYAELLLVRNPEAILRNGRVVPAE